MKAKSKSSSNNRLALRSKAARIARLLLLAPVLLSAVVRAQNVPATDSAATLVTANPAVAPAPAITAPAKALPVASDASPRADKVLAVGKLTPEQLKARQDAEDRARAAQAKGPAAVAVANSADADRAEPQTPVDYLKDNEWQRHAEIRSGNVTVLRRSTDEPPAPNETVILRWRTPTEFSKSAFMSSKGHTPNVSGK